jgi:hypothetical protein
MEAFREASRSLPSRSLSDLLRLHVRYCSESIEFKMRIRATGKA